MTESPEKQEEGSGTRNTSWQDEVFTKVVRAGSRTYYFDVKAVRDNSRYITITESKRKTDDAGNPFYLKHKIFLYAEDFKKFLDGLNEAMSHVHDYGISSTVTGNEAGAHSHSPAPEEKYPSVRFEDLDK